MLSACDGCCDDCNCCVEGSPVATKTTSVSFCTTNGCPNGNFKSTNNPDGAGCSAACNNKYLNQNNGLKGCTNPQAVNWNRDATIDDNSCIVKGCMEKCADNFDGDATQADNSTCKYSPQCTDPAANKAVPANCYSKVTSDRSKCNFNKDPDPTNPDVKPITITSADVCVTQSSAKDLPVGAEVTFRATYTYEGSKNIYLKMIRGTADCLNCDTPKKLSTGKDLQTYSQFVIETSNDLGRSFLVQISTRNPISGSQTAEQTAEKVVIASTNTPACQSMVEGKYKPLGASTAPAKPTIAKVTLASSILTVTVKHDVREPSLISSNTLNNNEKVPDYYVVAYDDYKNRSLYKSGDAVDMDAWYKAIVEGGKGTVKVFRPAKKSPEEESFASPADNQKTYAIFVKAINIVWPYEAEPPSIVPKVSAAEGSPMAQTVYPTATSAVSIASKDRMLKATVTIPASANNASFTLKSATQDMGTYDNLLGTSGSQTYHIYAGEDEIFSDAENADPAADAYSDQKVTIVRDPANDRKFYLYAGIQCPGTGYAQRLYGRGTRPGNDSFSGCGQHL